MADGLHLRTMYFNNPAGGAHHSSISQHLTIVIAIMEIILIVCSIEMLLGKGVSISYMFHSPPLVGEVSRWCWFD